MNVGETDFWTIHILEKKKKFCVLPAHQWLIFFLSHSHTSHTDTLTAGLLFATDKPSRTEEYLPSKERGSLAQPNRTK